MIRTVALNSRALMGKRVATRSFAAGGAPPFHYQDLFEMSKDTTTPYTKITSDHVSTVEAGGMKFLKVEPEGLRLLSAKAMVDVAHLLRPGHLQMLSNILKDPEATSNDRFGGGSANKSYLYQQTKSLLNPKSLMKFLEDNIKTIGTSACPPYHLSIAIGGLSADLCMKTMKLASTKYYDNLPTSGNEHGRAFRDLELEQQVLELTRKLGIGAQFGGKYFCHDVRVVRMPRHGASCPVSIGVSCSADRQMKAKITSEGIFVEQLETDVGKYLPEVKDEHVSTEVVKVDINQPMSQLRETLSKFPVTTRLSLTGTLVVARDIAHAKILERVEAGQGLPQYIKDHIIYYAGPAKTPEGYASGSFGPTTAGRMDSYVDKFMENGGSYVTLAKGNRSKGVTAACKKHGGFYLGSIGGPAAILAKNCIKKVEVLEYPELGMEAVWKIEVQDFPAFIVVDDKGNDFFSKWIP
eukprot:gene450-298_t